MASGCALVLMTACQTVPYQGQARDVKRKPKEGGLIAIPVDYRPEDRYKADEKMRNNCAPLVVKVTNEEEAVVGQKTETDSRDTHREKNESQVGSLFGIPMVAGDAGGKDTKSSATTTSIKEWQISYQCEITKTTSKR